MRCVRRASLPRFGRRNVDGILAVVQPGVQSARLFAWTLRDYAALHRPFQVRLPVLPPDKDLEARLPVWDSMQMFWMDVDPLDEIHGAAKVCAASKYSIGELKAIFLNEVRPAVSFNLHSGPAPEWTGFKPEWLAQRILRVHKFNKRLPFRWLNPYAYAWWERLESAVQQVRQNGKQCI